MDCLGELEKLRVANGVAQRLLSGNAGVAKGHLNDGSIASLGKTDSPSSATQDESVQMENYHDIWGASKYLIESPKTGYIREHLAKTEAILSKTGLLLYRVPERVSYEIVEDSEQLMQKKESSWMNDTESVRTFSECGFEDDEKTELSFMSLKGTVGSSLSQDRKTDRNFIADNLYSSQQQPSEETALYLTENTLVHDQKHSEVDTYHHSSTIMDIKSTNVDEMPVDADNKIVFRGSAFEEDGHEDCNHYSKSDTVDSLHKPFLLSETFCNKLSFNAIDYSSAEGSLENWNGTSSAEVGVAEEKFKHAICQSDSVFSPKDRSETIILPDSKESFVAESATKQVSNSNDCTLVPPADVNGEILKSSNRKEGLCCEKSTRGQVQTKASCGFAAEMKYFDLESQGTIDNVRSNSNFALPTDTANLDSAKALTHPAKSAISKKDMSPILSNQLPKFGSAVESETEEIDVALGVKRDRILDNHEFEERLGEVLWDPYCESYQQSRKASSKQVLPRYEPMQIKLFSEPLVRASCLKMPLSSKDFVNVWDMLPNELVLIIFSFLPQDDLKKLSVVCQRFNVISKDACLWLKASAMDKELSSEWLESFVRVHELSIDRCKARGLNIKAFRQFFQKNRDSLKHIHLSQCTHKSLYGDNILLLASTYCRNLESISMPWSNTTDNGISALETCCISLKFIDFSGNCFISDSSMNPLLKKVGGTLRTLKLNGCFALTNDTFSAIAPCCPHLTVLEIGLCPKVTSDCLVLISQALPNLRELDLRGLKCVNDACLEYVSKTCKSLSKLVIANCQLITDVGISSLAVELPGIKTLDLSGCSKAGDNGCSILASNLRGPTHLNLSSTGISHITVSMLTENFYSSLESLKLSFCNNITQECVETLVSFCYKLRCLHLHGCKRLRIQELQNNQKALEISH